MGKFCLSIQLWLRAINSWTSNVKCWYVQNTIGWFINNLIKLLSFIKQSIVFKKNIWILIFWHKIFEFLVSHPLLPISGLKSGVLARVRPSRLILIYLLLMFWKFTCLCSTMQHSMAHMFLGLRETSRKIRSPSILFPWTCILFPSVFSFISFI